MVIFIYRYDIMKYNRVGNSGLKLPIVSLGLWHNFGTTDDYQNMKKMCFTAFDNGITVYVNYGDSAVATPDGEVDAHDYLVLESPS